MAHRSGALRYGRIAATLLACAASGALASIAIARSGGAAASAAYYDYCPGGGAGGNYGYCPPTTTTPPPPGFSEGGNFVIGDLNSAIGTPVTFWGAQWWKRNALSGGPAPASFKGFANDPDAPPACGTGWSTDPGNSSDPPDTIPPLMAVIVSSSISKSGSTISGNTPRVVVVRTDPGYAPNPGHAGTGTVVGVVC